jgi:hypothetical protein
MLPMPGRRDNGPACGSGEEGGNQRKADFPVTALPTMSELIS